MKATSHAASGGDPTAWINVLSDGRSTVPQSASKSAIASVQSTSKRETTSGASTSRAAVSSASSRASRVGSLIGSHVLDVDVLDLRDLVDEQIDEPGLGKGDDQLVDRAARSPFEDLDAHDVAAHGTDAARDLPERTGAIRQPDPHRVVLHHSCTLRTLRERTCFSGSGRGGAVRRPGARSTDCRAQRVGAGGSEADDGDSEFGQRLAKVSHGLVDALLVLDEREPHERVASVAEPDARRRRHLGFLYQE